MHTQQSVRGTKYYTFVMFLFDIDDDDDDDEKYNPIKMDCQMVCCALALTLSRFPSNNEGKKLLDVMAGGLSRRVRERARKNESNVFKTVRERIRAAVRCLNGTVVLLH